MVKIQKYDDCLAALGEDAIIFYDAETMFSAYGKTRPDSSVSEKVEEFYRLREASQTALREMSSPKNLMLRLLLTGRCNLNCSYCQMKDLTMYNAKDIPLEKIEQILKEVKKREYDYTTIHFSGGEPMMAVRLIEQICECVQEIRLPNVRFAMSTNGTLLSDQAIAMLKKYNIKVVVSIDGYRHANDARVFHSNAVSDEQVLRSCKRMLEKQVPIGISMVFNELYAEQSVASVERLIRSYDIQSLGFNYRHFSAFHRFEDGDDTKGMASYAKKLSTVYKLCRSLNVFEEQSNRIVEPFVYQSPRKGHCTSQSSQSSFMPDGTVGPCKTFAAAGKDTVSFESWLAGEESSQAPFQRWRDRSVDTLTHCKDCPYRNLCGGGCAYEAYVINGDIGTRDMRYCMVPKQIFRTMMELLVESDALSDRSPALQPLRLEQRKVLLSSSKTDKFELTASIGHYLE